MKHSSLRCSLLLLPALCASLLIPCVSGLATDVSITAANVLAGENPNKVPGVAGAVVTAGQVVYLDPTTSTWKLADCDGGATTAASGYQTSLGYTLSGGAAGQPIYVLLEGADVTVGGTLSLSAPFYVLSGTAGGVAPIADLAAGDIPVFLFIAKSTTKAVFKPVRGPVVVAAP